MKKSFMSRVLAVTLSAAMAFSLSSANMVTAEAASTPKLTTSPATTSAKKLVVLQGAKAKLTVKSVKGWKVTAKSNSTAATVKVTKASTAKPVLTITGKTAGKNVTVTLTAKKGKKKATKKVYVYVGKKSASVAAATVKAGESTTLALKTSAMRKTWKITKAVSSDEAVAKVTKTAAKQVTVEGVKEGSANITVTYKQRKYANKATATGSAKTAKAKVTVTAGTETPVEDSFKITSVEATKANELKVTFAEKIESTKDVKFTVTRGTDTVSINDATIMWDTDAKVATIQTASDMIDGTYTVSAEYNGKTATGTVVVGKGYTIDTNSAINIVSVKATKVKELTVTFHETLVSTSAVKFTVTKNNSNVELSGNPVWTTSGSSVATLTTAENMTAGTYVVKAELGTSKSEGSTEVTSQKVTEIKIINETALTGKGTVKSGTSTVNDAENGVAYVYYDVLDQYGESMRETTSLTWSFSCTKVNDDKTLGRITLKRSDSAAFTYGEQISVNATHPMTGVTAYKLLKVGQAQAVDAVILQGFVKKNTTKVEKSLPKGFNSDEWYMVFTGKDQNDCEMDTSTEIKTSDITFLPANPLLIKEIKIDTKNNVKTMTIDGKTYYAAVVEPGINVNEGGTSKVTVIGNHTGKQTELEVIVGEYTRLAGFEILSPKSLVADGEKVEIGYNALDTEGKQITDFVVLASQSQFNDLSLSTSVGELKLEEQADGSAKLFWYDTGYDITDAYTGAADTVANYSKNGWDASTATDGMDRQISLTSVVVGAGSSNQMISVSDKARPTKIKDVDLDKVIIGGDIKTLRLSDITFEDQYGRDMKKLYEDERLNEDNLEYTSIAKVEANGAGKRTYAYDNGFFYNTSKNNHKVLQGTDFAGYEYLVRASSELITDKTTYFTTGTSIMGTTVNSITSGSGMDLEQNYSWRVGQDQASPVTTGYTQDGSDWEINDNFCVSTKLVSGKESGAERIRFQIYKINNNSTDKERVSEGNYLDKEIRVVSIDKMKNFTVKAIDPIQVTVTGEAIVDSRHPSGASVDFLNGVSWGLKNEDLSKKLSEVAKYVSGMAVRVSKDVEVTASYNGTTVDVPEKFLAITTGEAIGYEDRTGNFCVSPGGVTLNHVVSSGVFVSDLYNNDSNLTKKMGNRDVKVRVCGISAGAIVTEQSIRVADLTANVKFSDEIAVPTTILAKDVATIRPTYTNYIVSGAAWWGLAQRGLIKDAKLDSEDSVITKDQYGETMDGRKGFSVSYKVSSLKENESGYAGNNLKVTDNESIDAIINGAELGDTMTIEITAKQSTDLGDFKTTKNVAVTVGADEWSYISSVTPGNMYQKSLVDGTDGLEKQRNDGLGNNTTTATN